jgi:hypothetical protein
VAGRTDVILCLDVSAFGDERFGQMEMAVRGGAVQCCSLPLRDTPL